MAGEIAFDDLIPQGGAPAGMSFDDLIPPPQPSGLARVPGRTLYDTTKGLASFPGMIGDAANSAINLGSSGLNKVLGTNIPMLQMPSVLIDKGIQGAGGIAPASPPERIASAMGQGLMTLPFTAGSSAVSGVEAMAPLAQDLSRQATSIMGATGAAQTGDELKLPTWMKLGLGIAGGIIGGIRPGMPNPAATSRLQDFNNAGIPPSVGDVTQSSPLQMAQKASTKLPLSGTAANEMSRLGDMQSAVGGIAGQYGAPSTAQAIGEDTQAALNRYRFGPRPPNMTDADIMTAPTSASSVTAKANILYDRIPVAPDAAIPIADTKTAIEGLTQKYSSSALNDMFSDPTLAKLKTALESADNGTLPWQDVRNLRTDLRYLQTKASLTPTIDDRALSKISDALTSDLREGAQAYGGERGLQMMNRADAYWGQSMQRLDSNLKSVYNTNRPEAVYQQITSAMSPQAARSDLNKLASLRRISTPDEWHDIAATVVSNLGKPTAGAPIASGTPNFSVGKFVTDYNNISPQAKDLLFNGAGQGELRSALDRLARVGSYMKTTDSLANASHSGELGGQIALATGIATHPHVTIPLWGAGVIGSRAMYNPAFVNLMTKTLSVTSPQAAGQTAAQITMFARQNPTLAPEAHELLKHLVPVQAGQSDLSK